MVTSRFEIDADHFAVDLIYSDDDLCDMPTAPLKQSHVHWVSAINWLSIG